MATISSAGIGSGLDVESIVRAIVAAERRPIEQLQGEKTRLQTQLSTFGKLQSTLGTLRDSMRTLADPATWRVVQGSSADASVVSVTTSAGSIPSSYQVSVTRLASAQQLASGAFDDGTAVVGEGTLTIDFGRWRPGEAPPPDPDADPDAPPPPAGPPTFNGNPDRASVSIAIGPEDNTLARIRDRINAAGAGVTASIVNDASGARLTLRSSETGEAHGFRIRVADADGDGTDAAGLSRLAYDPGAGIEQLDRTQVARNARANINGLNISSPGNTLSNVIDGLTLTLGKTTPPDTTVDVTVRTDTEAIKKAVTDFSSAYNDVIKFLREQTRVGSEGNPGGPLATDSTAIALQRQLRSLLGGTSGASATLQRLADIGLDPQADGTLKLGSAKLDAALGNLPELQKMFAGVDDANPANEGFAVQMRRFADVVLGTDGSLASRQDGLRTRIERNDDRQDQLEGRLSLMERRIRAQYTALDTRMGELNGLSSYLAQQLAQLNRT